jgi:hypothetical protein
MITRFEYSIVYFALAKYFEIGAEQKGQFDGRIRHLQRVGLFEHIGKGVKRKYSLKDAFKFCVAIQLTSLGIEPSNIPGLLSEKFMEILFDLARANRDLKICALRPVCGEWSLHIGLAWPLTPHIEFSVGALLEALEQYLVSRLAA